MYVVFFPSGGFEYFPDLHISYQTAAERLVKTHFFTQFQQFQALTQARLDMLAQNQNRNFSGGLESRVQALSDHWRHMTQDLEQLKQSTTQEIEGLRLERRVNCDYICGLICLTWLVLANYLSYGEEEGQYKCVLLPTSFQTYIFFIFLE